MLYTHGNWLEPMPEKSARSSSIGAVVMWRFRRVQTFEYRLMVYLRLAQSPATSTHEAIG